MTQSSPESNYDFLPFKGSKGAYRVVYDDCWPGVGEDQLDMELGDLTSVMPLVEAINATGINSREAATDPEFRSAALDRLSVVLRAVMESNGVEVTNGFDVA